MKKIILAALVFGTGSLVAQQPDTHSFAWGGMAGFESQMLGIQSTNTTNEPDQMYAESGRVAHGVSVGIFGRWHLWKGVFLQQGASLSALQSTIDFYPDGPEYYRFADLELPLHFVLTNQVDENARVRGSFLLGARVGWNFALQNTEQLYLLPERLAVDAGLGVEIRLPGWRLQPELVYSLGLNNIHDVTNAPYDWVVGRVVRDKLTLRLLFWKDGSKN